MKHFDYVVEGAGSSGCVGNRLSENAAMSVLVETEPKDRSPYIAIREGPLPMKKQGASAQG